MNDNLSSDQFETLYHLTDRAKFKPNPRKVPQDNALSINAPRDKPGMYLTDSPEAWINGHDYIRPFVAEVQVPKGLAHDERWSGEKFLPAEHFGKAQVSRVMPIDAHAREQFGGHGWVEEYHGTTFDTGEKIHQPAFDEPYDRSPFRGYHYDGPDVRDMSPDVVKYHRQRTREFLRARLKERG